MVRGRKSLPRTEGLDSELYNIWRDRQNGLEPIKSNHKNHMDWDFDQEAKH